MDMKTAHTEAFSPKREVCNNRHLLSLQKESKSLISSLTLQQKNPEKIRTDLNQQWKKGNYKDQGRNKCNKIRRKWEPAGTP
jgi:hypothetical protein